MPIIIDGHNLLWSIQKPSEDSELITDVKLCYIIGRYLKLIDQNGEIVFDGKGPPDKSGFDNISNLEVLFAGLATDADTVIEDKIKALYIVGENPLLSDKVRCFLEQSAKTIKMQTNCKRTDSKTAWAKRG